MSFPVQFPETIQERSSIIADVTVPDISQRYRMQNVLGAGAQATVYQAQSKKSNRKVAVKVRSLAYCLQCPTPATMRRCSSPPPQD